MPTYAYECVSCKSRVELTQKINERSIPSCEKCGGKMETVLSATTFILKGGGWGKSGYSGGEK